MKIFKDTAFLNTDFELSVWVKPFSEIIDLSIEFDSNYIELITIINDDNMIYGDNTKLINIWITYYNNIMEPPFPGYKFYKIINDIKYEVDLSNVNSGRTICTTLEDKYYVFLKINETLEESRDNKIKELIND